MDKRALAPAINRDRYFSALSQESFCIIFNVVDHFQVAYEVDTYQEAPPVVVYQ
jgi:hypothetical protein